MAKAPKVARRDLKEDKVYMTLAEAYDYFVRYRTWIIVGALAMLAMFAAAYGWNLRSQGISAEASWALYQAKYLESAEERNAALSKVAADYGGTPSARFASFEMANTLYDNGRYDEALGAFQEFLKKNRNHLLAPSAMEAMGYCHESLGRWKEAADTYQKLIKKYSDSPVAARANYRVGVCYEKLGEKEKAIEAYEKVAEFLPDTLWARYSNERLDSLIPTSPSPFETMPLDMAPTMMTPPEVAPTTAAPPEGTPIEAPSP